MDRDATADLHGDGPVHSFSMQGRKLAAYYSSGETLRAKHATATGDSGISFPEWALGLLDVSEVRWAVDTGCGWGRFAVVLASRLAPGAQLLCTDVFPGMVSSTRDALAKIEGDYSFAVADIENLPLRAESVDLAMANHVLYHLPNIGRGISELDRILTPGGKMLATTNADDIRIPIIDAHHETMRRLGIKVETKPASIFSLENGRDLLSPWFEHVEEHVFEDTLLSDAERLTSSYLNTGRFRIVDEDDALPLELRRRVPYVYRDVADEMADDDGTIFLPILMAAYVCERSVR